MVKVDIFEHGFQIFAVTSIFINLVFPLFTFCRINGFGFLIYLGLFAFNFLSNGAFISDICFKIKRDRTKIQKWSLILELFFASTFPMVPFCIFAYPYAKMDLCWIVPFWFFLSIASLIANEVAEDLLKSKHILSFM